MKIERVKKKCKKPSSKAVRVSTNLIRQIKKIKLEIKKEFKKKHGVKYDITDTKATKVLGMFLEGDQVVRITHNKKSINIRLVL